jgi:hypothetical protein
MPSRLQDPGRKQEARQWYDTAFRILKESYGPGIEFLFEYQYASDLQAYRHAMNK